MKYNYVTIEREYGSGGTKIARLLAEKTGLPCYGREIIETVAKENNLSVERIDRYEETVSNSFLYSLYLLSKSNYRDTDMLSKEGHIYLAEQAVIQKLAAGSRSIFLGHCAAEALKERSGVLHVFIRSGLEQKRKRVMEDYGIAERNVESTMQKFDNKRANYYYANTSRKWLEPDNYDIVLDSGTLGLSRCADILAGLLQE